jgi:hypothetical protein
MGCAWCSFIADIKQCKYLRVPAAVIPGQQQVKQQVVQGREVMMGGNMEQFSPPAWVKLTEWLHRLLCSANSALQCIEIMGSKFPVWSIIFQENESSATPLQKPHISHEIDLSKAYQVSQKYFSAAEWKILASHEMCHMNLNILTIDNILNFIWNFDLNIIFHVYTR